MISALNVPLVAVASSEVIGSEYSYMKEKLDSAGSDGGYIDNYLANLMHCRPIAESKSLPEAVIQKKLRTRFSHKTISSTADPAQSIEHSEDLSPAASPLGDRDRTTSELSKGDGNLAKETEEESKPHPPRCECGCIPKIPSLFEMAELRRQYRERLKVGSTS